MTGQSTTRVVTSAEIGTLLDLLQEVHRVEIAANGYDTRVRGLLGRAAVYLAEAQAEVFGREDSARRAGVVS